MPKMPFPKYERLITIAEFRPGADNVPVGHASAEDLPKAIRAWFAAEAGPLGLSDPLFTANTVTAKDGDGDQVTYVATD